MTLAESKNIQDNSDHCPRIITDELETVCGLLPTPVTPSLLSPPTTTSVPVPVGPTVGRTGPRSRVRHASEMSNSEIAIYLEKETLRDAEESDYKLMEDLINRRYELDETDSASLDMERFGNNAFFLPVTDETEYRSSFGGSGRALRRSSAIDGPPPEEIIALSTAASQPPLAEEESESTPTPTSAPTPGSSSTVAAAHTQAQQLSARLRKSSISDSRGSLVPPSMETMC